MKYFTIRELTKSATAEALHLANEPNATERRNLEALVDRILDPLRTAYGKPIYVTSGYRSPKVNAATKGSSPTSQHVLGQAADIKGFDRSRKENKRLFELVQQLKLPWDQLIWEYGSLREGPDWVHVSFGPRNRRQIIYEKPAR